MMGNNNYYGNIRRTSYSGIITDDGRRSFIIIADVGEHNKLIIGTADIRKDCNHSLFLFA